MKMIGNLTDGVLSDEMFMKNYQINRWKNMKKFGNIMDFFLNPAIDESKEYKGIEFFLDYSLLNDLGKDFVKDNIKNLFQ